VSPDLGHSRLSFQSFTFFTARRKSFDLCSDLGRAFGNPFF
jgi:hypothetical protein